MLQTSEQTLNVWTKLFKIQEKNLSVIKSTPNAAYKQNGKVSKYADLNSILEVLIPELNEVKLATGFMLTGEGLILQVTDIETGEWIRYTCTLNLTGQNAQQIGSQITYFRRYMLNSLFNLQAEDDDGNLASGVRVSEVEAPKATEKVELRPNSPETAQLKKEYDAGQLTKWSQVTNRFIVPESLKLSIKAHMPKINFDL